MAGRKVEIEVGGRAVPIYHTAPPQPGPGIIVLQEWWGLVPHIENLVDRFAAEGLNAMAPDLYGGQVARSPDDAAKLMMALDIGRTASTLHGTIRHLLRDANTASRKLGVVGFCMGGQLALYAACRFPREIGVCVDFYGIHPAVKPDLPSLEADFLGFFAELDPSVPPASALALKAELERLGKRAEIEVFPGVNHAFFNDTRPEVHAPREAAICFARAVAAFQAL